MLMNLEFSGQIFEKKSQISSLIKTRPEGAELFDVDDGHEEANSRFSQSCESALKKVSQHKASCRMRADGRMNNVANRICIQLNILEL